MASEPTVFIVDDDAAVRDTLKWLLTSVQLRVEVFDAASEFLESYDPEVPGCLLLDVRMPGMSGLQLQAQLESKKIELPIIFISGHGDVQMAVRAMKSGAVDFIEKPFNNQAVIDAVQRAIDGIRERLSVQASRVSTQKVFDSLTERERQVLDGVVEGCTNKQIANRYGLSEKTIEFHRSKLMKKLNVKSMAQLMLLVSSIDQP
ncbi:MAG: response regulator transcription factor [Rhodospirillales bacterium]